MDTKTKRAAALGYGLSFLLVLPVAEGAITIAEAGHALSAYSYDITAVSQNQLVVRMTDSALVGSGCTTEVLTGAELDAEAVGYAGFKTEVLA
jgi:hypothetical protein